ncbi:hypothetical protein PR202_gb02762 [Eleusine coracana subsp. coracana]|uniref:Wall-associated receptor kinase galacturonan-binding domain-containing protein n=1 Tax=Eleusine coracana subsp. coracana TaxID=191504 RepID=A0AAV5DYJ5_ELECO|nr:hypothetical protein PR202_gb02762 [Eleusine coracana subsp. coracana]
MERVERIVAFYYVLVVTVVQSLGALVAHGQGSRCTRRCGSIDIPYPFGVEPGCYHAAGFNVTCSHRYHPPKLFLGDGTVEVLNISVPDGTVRINSPPLLKDGARGVNHPFWPGLVLNGTWGGGLPKDGPFFVSESANILRAIGCNIQVDLWERVEGCLGSLVGSCTALCPVLSPKDNTTVFPYPFMPNGSCAGLGCCQADIILGYSSYSIQVQERSDSDSYSSFSLNYSGIYIVDQDFAYHEEATWPPNGAATLDWLISNSRCPENTLAPECRSDNSFCRDYVAHSGTLGYLCQCSRGYQGNPYVRDGCQATHRELILANVLLALQAMLLSQMDAKILTSVSTRRHIRAMEYA